MKRASFRHSHLPAKHGAALLIVLFFIVLLTGLLIAFLSRALTARVVANTSAGEAKVSVLAGSAGDIIIGDLKQEIIDGSTATNVATGYTVYNPKGASSTNGLSTMTPAISGFTPTYSAGQETDGLANLVKVSKYGIPSYTSATNANYATAGISRASNVNSSSSPSFNGRVIKPARWNSHYLIARATTGTNLDSTPVANFPVPDWVIVTRGGAGTVYSSYNATLSDSTESNTNYAVGRYAYAIYNEGGLLDMNAAGYPGTDSGSGSIGLTATQISKKGSLALADLTQLPVSATSTTAVMTQAQINNLVGWRNYYTAQLTAANGSFGSIVFDAKSAQTNWINNFVTYNGTNAFLGANTNSLANPAPPTDQAFVSRQQLISLTQSLGISPDALQYLGTFSRGLDQPSYTPDPNRPTVINPATPPPPATGATGANVDAYLGNNDGAGADNIINPAFLNIRVTTSFTRFDGTTAQVGEPLVKKKYALSRLGLVTYNGTNASVIATNATTADPDPVYDRFGLKRSSTSSAWVYNHGIVSSSGGGTIIGTLAQVAAAGREPDFAELLKAALTVGSLAKGGPGLAVNQGNYQYVIDTAIDYQVLQIMANLIDQYDTDSYPTWIQITSLVNGSSIVRNFYGVEDLPYFYRYHLFTVVDRLPVPLLSSTNTVTFPPNTNWITTGITSTSYQYPSGTVTANSWNVTQAPYPVKINGAQAGTLQDTGEATYYYIPDLWNPHDPNTLATSSSNRPTAFRAVAETQDPTGANPWQIGVENVITGSGNVAQITNSAGVVTTPGQSSFQNYIPENNYPTPNPPSVYNWPISVPSTLTKNMTALNFYDNGGSLFREPTLLWNTNPTGINLSHPDTAHTGWIGSAVEVNTGKTYYGIVAGKVPISTQVTYTSSPHQSTDGSYVLQGGVSENNLQVLPTGAYAQITFSLQYQDPANSTNWITYDVKYPDLHGLFAPSLVVNTADYPGGIYLNPIYKPNNQLSDHASSFDPRSARWGVGTESMIGLNADHGNDYVLENTAHTFFGTNTAAGYAKMGSSNFSVFETQKPRADLCNFVNYSNPGMTSNPGKNKYMRWFSGTGYSASGGSGDGDSPNEYDGLLSQNLPSITLPPKISGNPIANMYVEDADGIARPAMGAYAYAYKSTDPLTTADSSQSSLATASAHRTGLPMATASSYSGDNGTGTATTQSQSRAMILNRPFRSVSDMSYAFRGTPWKNIDFFTPTSGDSALLDVFCVNEPPSNAIVAGKVDLNTRQMPVLKAVISGGVRDEIAVASTTAPSSFQLSPAGSTLSPLTSTEAGNAAAKLVAITTASDAWRGPLANIASLVGHFVASPGTTAAGSIGTDWYTYSPPVLSVATTPTMASSYTYAGLTGALDSTVYTAALPSGVQAASPYMIQRFRESALRPLIDVGQTRVWNLLIDVIAQTGRYPRNATGLDQFIVDGEKRLWIHVAIDRYTGEVIDKQVEVVTQ